MLIIRVTSSAIFLDLGNMTLYFDSSMIMLYLFTKKMVKKNVGLRQKLFFYESLNKKRIFSKI